MYKTALFRGQDERGVHVIPLFGPSDGVFEKTAAPTLLPEVVRYIEQLRPRNDAQYVLLNALGAGEWWGANVNGDFFPEASLIHAPDDWRGVPVLDKLRSRDWPYGFPTFYYAKPFLHHRNKDYAPFNHPAYGEVELAAWNDRMKRVELVARVDKHLCEKHGGTGIWDKLKMGQFPDLSMGCFSGDMPVQMADGTSKPISEVRVGDFVLTHLGRARRVTDVFCRKYTGTIYGIRAESREALYCTRQHPFLAVPWEAAKTHSPRSPERKWRLEPQGCPEWVNAENLWVSDFLMEPACAMGPSKDVHPALARLLGFYLADGHVIRQDGRFSGVQFSINKKNPLLQEVAHLAQAVGLPNDPVLRPHPDSEEAVYVYLYGASFAETCSRFCGELAKTKKLSQEVLGWSDSTLLLFLGAYGSGDGTSPYAGSIRFSTSSNALADQLQVLLTRLRMPSAKQLLVHKEGTGFNRTATYEWVVNVGLQWAGALAPYCSKLSATTPRKKKESRKFFGNLLFTPIREVTKFEVVGLDVYNLEVEEDHSYQVRRLAVHNCKVPFDYCAVCVDMHRYQDALATFQKGRHKSPGDAVLEVHKKNPIRGVAVTRKNYCEHALSQMNRILPDGRKVYVVNDFPRFFDISFVFIGADKTAKVMLKIAGEGENAFRKVGTATAAEPPAVGEKVASSFEEAILGKDAAKKEGEMTKDVIPSQFAAKAVPIINRREPDISRDVLDGLATRSLPSILSTATGMGMVLRPREFQRIVLIQMKRREDADLLDRAGHVFPRVEEEIETPMRGEFFSPVLARLLFPLMRDRSALRPILEKRILILSSSPTGTEGECSSLSSPLLHKISAAYNGYRVGAMRLVEQAEDMMSSAAPLSIDFHKLASSPNLFSPLSKVYFETAYWGEIDKRANAGVERELPSGNTWSTSKKVTGGT